MANKTIDALVKCPFYLEEKGLTVACEGYAKNTCMITRFPGTAEKHAYLKRHCYREDGGACFLARSLYRKYEDEK